MKKISFKWVSIICGLALSLWIVSCKPSESETTSEEQTTNTTTTTEQPTPEPATANADAGKAIVTDMAKCGMCHKLTEEKLIGPGLKGVTKRRTEDWIKSMIKDPAGFVQSDPDAKKLFEEHNKTPMTAFPLTDAELDNVIAFLKANDAQ